jgi:hypothetical protein
MTPRNNTWFPRSGHARTKGSAMTATRVEQDSLGPVYYNAKPDSGSRIMKEKNDKK